MNAKRGDRLAGRPRRHGRAPETTTSTPRSRRTTSSDDLHLAATEALATEVVPALEHLEAALRRRAADWSEVVKAGRTHLMDAVPITLGQEGVAGPARPATARTAAATRCPARRPADRRGTAVGTGLNAPDGFGAAVVAKAARDHRSGAARRGRRPHRGPGLA
ncbi:lyase family protein [Pseudonocardia sp. ICBG601]|uniref:lyase family protein n=1 Tax=Pseudonocardia sp. ICBG601 TaxID=2846759 RepID=UPI0021F6464B|nr:lyase family protein [Pseudonocardia sp. ICBG601]